MKLDPIDLRSDTVTKPTPAMMDAMMTAPVGDDVYGEDPTVTRLEAIVAEMTGKEAAVFVPSGTMGNLISVLAHCGRGDEMILGDQAHIHIYEQGGSAALGGVHSRTAANRPDGTLDLAQVEAMIRGDNEHFPVSRLICLENTHNRCGGARPARGLHGRGRRIGPPPRSATSCGWGAAVECRGLSWRLTGPSAAKCRQRQSLFEQGVGRARGVRRGGQRGLHPQSAAQS